MKNVLITGSNGQLGTSIRRLAEQQNEWNFIYTDIHELDIRNKSLVEEFLLQHNPDCLVNCAAYNIVEKAEDEENEAMLLNSDAVRNLAVVAKKMNIPLIHFSTDYVFDGSAQSPISEDETPSPLSAYARSKRSGEMAMLEQGGRGMIIRTSWLYSEYGQNFAKTILKKSGESEELKVIADQTGTPTYAGDLAETVIRLIPEALSLDHIEVLHYSNEGTASWYDFAYAIVKLRGSHCKVVPVRTEEYPLKAVRPHYSVLDKSRIKKLYHIEIPHWLDSLEKWYSNLKSNGYAT